MSGSSKKETNKSSGTVTPTNPAWVTKAIQDQTGRIAGLSGLNPYDYIAGASPLQQQAFAGAAGLGGQQVTPGNWAQGGGSYGQPMPADTWVTPAPGNQPTVRTMGPQTQPGSPQPTMGSTNSGGLPRSPVPMGQTLDIDPRDVAQSPMSRGAGAEPLTQFRQPMEAPPLVNATTQTQPGAPAQNRQGGAPTATNMGPPPGMIGQPSGPQSPGTVGEFFGAGSSYAQQVGQSGPSYGGPASLAGVMGYGATGYNAPQLGDAALFGGATAGPAQTFSGAELGPAAQMGRINLGQGQGYDPALLAGSAQAGFVGGGGGASLLRNLDDYMNPFTDDVVDASLADFDAQDARQRAAMAAQAGRDQAFGGSGYAIREGVYGADSNRARTALSAGLRSDAMNAAMGFSSQDAERRHQSGMQGAQLESARQIENARLAQQVGLANQEALNQAGRFGAETANQFGLAQGQFDQEAGMANAGWLNDMISQQGTFRQQAGLAGMDAVNQRDALNSGYQQQAGLAGMDALNQRNLQQGNLDATAGQFNANAQNAANQFYAGSWNDASQFNAGARNQMSQFDASQRDADLARQLQVAGLFGDFGNSVSNNTRQDLALQGQLGEMQRGIANDYLRAPLAMLEMQSGLLGQMPFNLFSGQNSTGTNTTRSSGWGFDFNKAGDAAASAAMASFFSDERLKQDVETVGHDHMGRRWVTFRYLWDETQRHLGIMAQELAANDAHAVSLDPSGFLKVDYARLA